MSKLAEDPVVIVSTARTAIGGFQGAFASLTAPRLGSAAIQAAVSRAGIEPEDVSEVLMGCVLPAGQGQAPARQASIGAGLPLSVPCTTVNKMCGSGMKTVMMGFDALHVRAKDVIVAGGMESMTNTPYLLPKMRGGARLGHAEVKDHMFLDGLEDAFDKGRLMGTFAEDTAQHYQFTREAQDAFAVASLKRSKTANEDGSFAKEIVPVAVKTRSGTVEVARDEQPFMADGPDPLSSSRLGRRTASPPIPARSRWRSRPGADAASEAKPRKLTPLARIAGVAGVPQAPAWFTTAPVGAIKKLLEQVGWSAGDVGLYEVNEAFAVVTMAAMRDIGVPHEKMNVHGGACALGHPIGASGARIIVTLLSAMQKYGESKGVAALCIGGGEATAVAIERVA
jgi:acetyl-CoA C-acetyltransferase